MRLRGSARFGGRLSSGRGIGTTAPLLFLGRVMKGNIRDAQNKKR